MAGVNAPTRSLKTARWSDYASLERTRDGGDPLGFRAAAGRVARTLSPALSQASSMTRGFGLLCLALSLTNQYLDADELVVRFERFHVLAQVNEFGNGATWPGKLRAIRLIDEAASTDRVRLDEPILDNQLSSGLWGAYRRPARLFGLTRPVGNRVDGRPSSTMLTQLGRDLASATRQQLFGPHPKKIGSWLWYDSLPVDDLGVFLTLDNAPTSHELGVLREGMRAFDRAHRFPYASLCDCFWRPSKGSVWGLNALDVDRLNAEQAVVVPTGKAIRSLIKSVEGPYRKWMATGDSGIAISPPSTQSDLWQQLREAHEQDLVDLHDRLSKAEQKGLSLFEAADAHQKWLARARAAIPWDHALPDKYWATAPPPDFGLSAPRGLFAEGLDASPGSVSESDET